MNFIYALLDPQDNEPRYIGKMRKGIDNRLRQHASTRRAVRSSHWIHNVMCAGYMPEAVELEAGLSETEWPEAEQFWIAYFKSLGADLTNHTKGGHDVVKVKGLNPFFNINKVGADRLARHKELHGTEHRVLWFILSRMNFEGKAFPKQAAIAEALGMPKSQVSVAIKRLVECGAISKNSRRPQRRIPSA